MDCAVAKVFPTRDMTVNLKGVLLTPEVCVLPDDERPIQNTK